MSRTSHYLKIFLMRAEKLNRNIMSLVLCGVKFICFGKFFPSVNVCTLKDHILNLDQQLCQISWQLYKKSSFNFRGNIYTMKAVIICCIDRGQNGITVTFSC